MDASVEFLLHNLKELVEYHKNLISGAKQDLELLKNDLDDLKAILKDASKKLTKHDTFKSWEKQIREMVYDIEDTIDTCITKIAADKAKKGYSFRKLFPTRSSIDLAEEVRNLRMMRVKPLLDKVHVAKLCIPDLPDKTTQDTKRIREKRRQNNIVGFDDEANTIIDYLNEETDRLEVISIIGMPGLGKTTLAWKITEDPRIKFEFPVVIWVNVSEDLHLENVLKTILERFTIDVPANANIHHLTELVRDRLASTPFLMVMDDVWTPNAWNQIRDCLPTEHKAGRVLITSRHRNVGTHANSRKQPHSLRFLTEEESWQLLQYEVYGELDAFPKELETVGFSIARDCDGLPLSIVVIGGILKDKISRAGSSVSTLKVEWLEISKRVQSYLVDKDKKNVLERIISLSYEKLPYPFRNCFLYLGMFPEDAEIPVKKLERLWIAEGFIQTNDVKSLEQVAEDNIEELINRNLLMVRKTRPGGAAKTCQVHDTIREFCKKEASVDEQNLFQEVQKTEQGQFSPTPEKIEKCRRLCIHSFVLEFFKGKPKQPLAIARSFLCFHKSPISLAAEDIAHVTDGFALLRVFEAENLKFPKFPPKLGQLMHLRYLTLAVGHDIKSLPKILSNLWNLQTLIVIASSPTLEIEADIWKMCQLRHLKTKSSVILKQDGEGQRGEQLQTLSRLSPESCTDEVFSKAKNLITLGIQGDLSNLMESRCLQKLAVLNKLKMVHVVNGGVAAENPMRYLPESNRFPPKLEVLVLSSTYLAWEKVSKLAMLVSLKKLKLKKYACKGRSWEVHDAFNSLELLHIEKSDLEDWAASPEAFPNLNFLVIKNCEKLQKIPLCVGTKLEMMYMERVTPKAVSCGHAIEEANKQQCSKGGVFKLEIAPADKQNR